MCAMVVLILMMCLLAIKIGSLIGLLLFSRACILYRSRINAISARNPLVSIPCVFHSI